MKTKQAAIEAARKKLGAAANEGVDFNVTNTGAGWAWAEIPAANEPAVKAKAKRAPKDNPAWTKKDFAKAKGPGALPAEVRAAFPKTKPEKTAAKAPRAPKAAKVPAPAPVAAAAPLKPPAEGTKGAAILTMLRRSGGASSAEMEKATGWKAASVRGYLGTLRSQGAVIESKKIGKGEPVVYKLHEPKTAPAAAPADVGDVV